MIKILFKNNKELSITQDTTIYQNENLMNDIKILIK